MASVYSELNPKNLDIRFISLFRDDKTHDVKYEMKNTASDLKHNAIMPGIWCDVWQRTEDYIKRW